jgi:hypothetical protein
LNNLVYRRCDANHGIAMRADRPIRPYTLMIVDCDATHQDGTAPCIGIE